MSRKEDENLSDTRPPEIYKLKSAYSAVESALAQIRSATVTKENAAELGCNFLAYEGDYFTDVADRASELVSLAGEDTILLADFFDYGITKIKNDIERWDQALADAQDGDFRSAKEILRERKEIEKTAGRTRHTDLSRNLGLIVKKLPDFGEPYILTQLPAWEDPRFMPVAKSESPSCYTSPKAS